MKHLAERANTELGGAAVALAPLIAPVPSVWAVWSAIGGWDGVAVAVAVELLGFGAAHTALRAYRKRQTDNSLFGLMVVALVLFAFYVVAVYAVLLGYKGISAALALPLLTIAGAGMYGINSQLDAAEIEPEREIELKYAEKRKAAELTAYRKRLSREVSGQVSAPVQKGQSVSGGQVSTSVLLDIWRDNPDASLRDVAAQVGRSKTWVGERRKELQAAGAIHVNGNGVEVTK